MQFFQAATTLSKATETNLTTGQMVTLYRLFHDVRPQNIRHVSLKPLTEIFEVTRLAEPGEAVRVPNGDYSAVRGLAANIFGSEQQISTEDQIRVADGR